MGIENKILILFELEFENSKSKFKTVLDEIRWVYYIDHPEQLYPKIIQNYEV
jgi:hypothetical protein